MIGSCIRAHFHSVVLLLAGLSGSAFLHGQSSRDFNRFKSGGYLNGLAWVVMSSEERSTFLLGFEDGIQAGIGRAVYRKWLSDDQSDTLVAGLLIRQRPGLDMEREISRIYNDDANLRVPISSVYQVVQLDLTPEGARMALEQLRKAASQRGDGGSK